VYGSRASRTWGKYKRAERRSYIGLPQSHISAIETGKVDPRLSSFIEMARQLDLEPLLVPRALVPAIQAMLAGEPGAPLWQVDDDGEEDG